MVSRLKEIDVLRGIAILLMITFHFLFDLNYFTDTLFNYHNTWYYHLIGRSAAIMFLGLVGVSLTLSYAKQKNKTPQEIYKKYITRGLKILLMGFGITAITYLFFPDRYIRFGVLHLIGLSVILAIPFLNLKTANLVFGSALIVLGYLISNITISSPWLLLLGIRPEQFTTLDYFPLLPWFGLILIGMYLGKTLYPNGLPAFKLPKSPIPKVPDLLAYFGKNSLNIYLVHQPIIILLIYATQML